MGRLHQIPISGMLMNLNIDSGVNRISEEVGSYLFSPLLQSLHGVLSSKPSDVRLLVGRSVIVSQNRAGSYTPIRARVYIDLPKETVSSTKLMPSFLRFSV